MNDKFTRELVSWLIIWLNVWLLSLIVVSVRNMIDTSPLGRPETTVSVKPSTEK